LTIWRAGYRKLVGSCASCGYSTTKQAYGYPTTTRHVFRESRIDQETDITDEKVRHGTKKTQVGIAGSLTLALTDIQQAETRAPATSTAKKTNTPL
jgi:hypothetical protein